MCPARDLPARPSLDSLRKQAKRLARDAEAGHPDAVARVLAQLPRLSLPLSLRDAQLVVAREYGFAGWSALAGEVDGRAGRAIGRAASLARAAIHNDDRERLRALLTDHPELVTWRDESGATLLDATTSYAMDCSDAERERVYTRPGAAGILIDAGAVVRTETWEHVVRTGCRGLLHLFASKDALPRTLVVAAALGDDAAVRDHLERLDPGNDDPPTGVARALLTACRFGHSDVALRLLAHAIRLDPALGPRIDGWSGRSAFVGFLARQPGLLWQESGLTLWQTFVVLQLGEARDRNDIEAFRRWLDQEAWILGASFVAVQADLMLPACYQSDREPFMFALLERDPAILHATPPPQTRSSLLVQALSYGNAHLIPLLTRIWPLPDDLPHAAGVGDATAVERWFDDAGRPALGSVAAHYPASDPRFPRSDLQWGPATTQQILDVALAWAVLNRQLDIAETLLRRGADIDTDWGTHEPASILHEAALQGNEAAVRFLIDHGADLTRTDFRYGSTAEGWARYGSGNDRLADLLASAATDRASRKTEP